MRHDARLKSYTRPFYAMIVMTAFFGLSGCQKTMEPLNLQNPALPTTPNYAFAAPKVLNFNADLMSPIFPVDSNRAAKKVVDYIQQQPRIETLKVDWNNLHFVFIQRTRVFRFPDQIEIKVIPIDGGHSSVLMLSRAQYGYYDFGVNQRRIKGWLKDIEVKME